ncbi:MAG: hypothetical protein K8H88_30695 [Sandaracinaceae bacterium]|nr:hypothetical protein [Sandaracinaceae bacterium]
MSGIQGLLAATQRGLGSLKVVMATGLYKTAAGVVGAKLLKDNAAGVRAYLTIQLRNGKQASDALTAIEDSIEHGDSTELAKGPTKKAGLYLAARNVVE